MTLASPRASRAAAIARWTALLIWLALTGWMIAWRLGRPLDLPGMLAAGALLLPLLLPLPGLWRGTRSTCAWATLCLVPCLLVCITEVIADPAARVWAATGLALALAAFAALIARLRASR